MAGGLLTKRALVLAKVEAAPGEDPAATAAQDAVLAEEPVYTSDPQQLERNFVSGDLSKFEHIIGRVVAGFQFRTELKGNGKQNSGSVADAPMVAKLMQGCGYTLVAMDGSGGTNLSAIVADKGNAAATSVAWAKGGTVTVDNPVLYTVEVTTGGAADGLTAEVIITGNNDAEDDLSAAAAQKIDTGTPLSLGAKGGEITPAVTGDLSVGDKWFVLAFPTGVMAKPVTDDMDSITVEMFFDGLHHKGHAGMGTFTIDAQAGDIPKVSFNFTTTFVPVTDTAIPAGPVYEATLPPQVEEGLLTWGGKTDLYSDAWTFDAGNQINPRMDVNAPQGYLGSRISDRTPVGGFNPEAQLEADAGFWSEFHAGTSRVFTTRVGKERGNMVVLFAPTAQTSDQSYTDRNSQRTLDKSIAFKRGEIGNDEMIFVFC